MIYIMPRAGKNYWCNCILLICYCDTSMTKQWTMGHCNRGELMTFQMTITSFHICLYVWATREKSWCRDLLKTVDCLTFCEKRHVSSSHLKCFAFKITLINVSLSSNGAESSGEPEFPCMKIFVSVDSCFYVCL